MMRWGDEEYLALKADIDRRLSTFRHTAESEPPEERRFSLKSALLGDSLTSHFNTLSECLHQYIGGGSLVVTDTLSGESLQFDEDGGISDPSGGWKLAIMLCDDPEALADYRAFNGWSVPNSDYGVREQKYRNALRKIVYERSAQASRAIAASCLEHWDKN